MDSKRYITEMIDKENGTAVIFHDIDSDWKIMEICYKEKADALACAKAIKPFEDSLNNLVNENQKLKNLIMDKLLIGEAELMEVIRDKN